MIFQTVPSFGRFGVAINTIFPPLRYSIQDLINKGRVILQGTCEMHLFMQDQLTAQATKEPGSFQPGESILAFK